MSAGEETPVLIAVRGLLAAHGATAEDAGQYAAALAAAGLLFDPERAEDIAAAARDQARAEVRAELAEVRAAPGCLAECGAPGYTRCELRAGHDGAHTAALGSLRRATWTGIGDLAVTPAGGGEGDA